MLAFESTQSKSAVREGGEHGWSVHYIHQAGSFVPLVQVRQARAMALCETTDAKALMEANGGVYDIEQDPLWNGEHAACRVRSTGRRRRSTSAPKTLTADGATDFS